jgi:DNA ligase-associated metallophosphoesterase
MSWRRAAAARAVREERPAPPAFAWACGEEGELCMELAAVAVRMRPSGALWLESRRWLVAGDLHLEKGSSYGARGQLLPPYDTRATLEKLTAEVAATEPQAVILLGDSFHDRRATERLDGEDRLRIEWLAHGRTLVWVTGNHDPDAPAGLPGVSADEVQADGLVLRHEPRAGSQPGEVAGHLHPCARVMGRTGSVRARAFLTDGSRMILPAFGAYAGGLNCRDVAFAGLWSGPVLAGALGRDRVHAVGPGSLAPD